MIGKRPDSKSSRNLLPLVITKLPKLSSYMTERTLFRIFWPRDVWRNAE
jgi:hypothetical protein